MPILLTDTPSARTSESDAQPIKTPRTRVTLRAFLVGLILALLMCAVLPYNDYYVGATYLSGNFFPIGALAALLGLVLIVNPVLISLKRRGLWTPAEIITVWTMMVVVAGIPSSGLMRYLIPHIVAPHYFANPNNGWESLIIAHMPARLVVTDPVAVRGFFEGLAHDQPIPWTAWFGPLAWWGLFSALLFLAFFCLSALLRRQWADNEKFSFPLVQLPVLLAETPGEGHRFNTLLRSPLLWVAVILVTCLHTLKGLHLFFPSIPDVPTVWHSNVIFTAKPWNVINDVQIAIYPLIIGFTYLLSTEICLSLWLFYVLFKAQVFMAGLYNFDLSQTGVGFTFGPSFVAYQECGGVLMTTVWLLYTMRSHLKVVWRKALYNAPETDDSGEPLSYRFALFGAIAAFAGLFGWLVLAADVQPLMSFAILLGALAAFIMLSWLVAQSGLLFASQTFVSSQILTQFVGTSPFNAQTLAVGSMTEHIGWQDAREFMMPSLLNSTQAAAETRLDARSLYRALAACVVLATVVAAVSSIWLPYTHGGGLALKNPWMYIGAPQLPFQWTATQLRTPAPPNHAAMLEVAAGALFVLTLFTCRIFIPSFELHPAGFLVAGSWALYMLWFSLFLGWLIKALILRYGGMRIYRSLLPFFLGLILGDCMNAILWTVVGLFTGTGYQLLPN